MYTLDEIDGAIESMENRTLSTSSDLKQLKGLKESRRNFKEGLYELKDESTKIYNTNPEKYSKDDTWIIQRVLLGDRSDFIRGLYNQRLALLPDTELSNFVTKIIKNNVMWVKVRSLCEYGGLTNCG